MIKEIHNDDCRKILSKIRDETIDGIFTDPPFNIDLRPQRKTHGTIANDALSLEEFKQLIDDVFGNLFRVLRPDRCGWVCCNWQCVSLFSAALESVGFTIPTWVVWVKNNYGIGSHFRPQHEFILPIFKGEPPQPENKSFSNVWKVARLNQTVHPTEKPAELISMALNRYNKAGDVILDPFAGSFSTCVVADNMGMGYIGIELRPEYYALGKQQLETGFCIIKNGRGKGVSRMNNSSMLEGVTDV